MINSDDDENHITATNPSVWTVKPLRYLKVFIVEVVLHNGPVGGRLGLIGCEGMIHFSVIVSSEEKL